MAALAKPAAVLEELNFGPRAKSMDYEHAPSRFLYELTGQSEKFSEGPAKAREKVGAKPRTRQAPR